MKYYGEKIEGITFPKFKEMYKKRLIELDVSEGVICSVMKQRTIDKLSGKTFHKMGENVDRYVSRMVFNDMLSELGYKSFTYSFKGSEFREEYEKRLKSLPNNS